METIYTNYDAGFKKALLLFKDKSLDFIGLENLPVVREAINTEHVDFEVKYTFSDMAFLLADGTGLNMEWEADISRKDLRRFAKYNLAFEEQFDMSFTTVIFTNKPTTVQRYESASHIFQPIIVNLRERNGEKVLEKIKKQIQNKKRMLMNSNSYMFH